MLTLPIKKKWFDMIADYTKGCEYRATTPYYIKRFAKLFEVSEQYLIHMIEVSKEDNMTIVLKCSKKRLGLRNGYSSKSPFMKIDAYLLIGKGREEWGAVKDETYFVLKIYEILEVKQ